MLLIMEYSLDKYKYFVPTKVDGTPYKVVAVSTYAGRTVRGVAKCDPKDTFDIEKGKQLAAARCQAKVSSQRLKRATKKLDEAVKAAEKELEEYKIEDEVTDVICDECGRNMVIKYGPHGKFLACPGFPECRNTKPYLEKIGVKCPKCDGEIILRKTKKGRKYYGCENNPECDFMSWQRPSGKRCPECNNVLLEKGNKLVCMDQQCGYVEARVKEENQE